MVFGVKYEYFVSGVVRRSGECSCEHYVLPGFVRQPCCVGFFVLRHGEFAQSPSVAARYHVGVFDASAEEYVQNDASDRKQHQHCNPGEGFQRVSVFGQYDAYDAEDSTQIGYEQGPVDPRCVQKRFKLCHFAPLTAAKLARSVILS